MSENLLKVRDLKGYYRGTFGVVHAVDGVTIDIDEGERVAIAGESGCGKSTFAQLITGTTVPLLHHEGGLVETDGHDVWDLSEEELRREIKCKRIAYVPQGMMDSINPVRRIKEYIADMYSERAKRTDSLWESVRDMLPFVGRKVTPSEAKERAIDHFEKLGLDADVLDVYPHELSGGMKQRAVIAISTLANPDLLVTDEPTSALDVTSQRRLIELMIDIQERGIVKSLITISHDLPTLRQLCNKVVIMYGGHFVEEGSMKEVVNDPLHPYTKALMNSLLPLREDIKGKDLSSIPGDVPNLKNPPSGCRFHPRCPKCMEVCKKETPPLYEREGRQVKCHLYK